MTKYKFTAGKDYSDSKLECLSFIANELAEANRLKRIELNRAGTYSQEDMA